MKATSFFNGLRAHVAFVVVILFATLFTACEPDEIEPIIPEKKLPITKIIELIPHYPNTVEINAEITDNGGEAIIAAGICWMVSGTPTVQNSNYPLEGAKISTYNVVISDFEAKTAWYFRAYVTTKNGTAYSEAAYFYYAPPVPPVPKKAVVAIKPATKVTMTSATIAAVLVPNQSDTKASFEYQSAGSSWKKIDLFLALEGKNLKDSIKLTLDLSDLTPNTYYSFRIKASNSVGEVESQNAFTTCAVADFDGNTYHEIQIGDQIWLQENLRTTHYADGDPIANVTDPVSWGKLTTGAYCWYNNDPEIGKVYGALYNFYVGVNSRGLIKGWHVPSDMEWETLNSYLGTNSNPTLWQIMETGTTHWLETSFYFTNSSGFTALPNGNICGFDNNNWASRDLGELSSFWTSSLFGPGAVNVRIIDKFLTLGGVINQNEGFGIRLVKD